MTLVIRPAAAADLLRLHPVIERAYRGETARAGWTHEADLIQGPRTSIAVLQAIVDADDQVLLMALEDDAPVGCVHLTDRGDGLVYLGLLCIDPLRQAAGLGKQLIAAAEETVRTHFAADRIEMTVIDSRTKLIAYYERRGFVRTDEVRDFPIPLDPPLFMTVLVKRLA
jgi:GNAT superfamily N-acetyltransferase